MLGNVALQQHQIGEAKAHLRAALEMLRTHGSSRSIAHVLEAAAVVAMEEGNIERALYLGGAADSLRRTIKVVSSWPLHREHRQRLETLRTSGQDAWTVGEAMARDDAIAYALDERGPVTAAP
jgi:ATP/maltotriose-dependent transcriptional regulator MalT